ncbi:E3 ubiquitin-protein ligase TRIM71-like isoform X1 [Gigantopelta aegis]|uniref:E3 ubiquitin-protein ligase TRIM71-like isoform X1 n=1 Tax=Gigantopelta aegis TaxID=1735272 RepID=UPI001B88BAB3|nr:E3 ubiquitin-protein ligase TRIM71-like isoform X1 [Gigantopelta aegis]
MGKTKLDLVTHCYRRPLFYDNTVDLKDEERTVDKVALPGVDAEKVPGVAVAKLPGVDTEKEPGMDREKLSGKDRKKLPKKDREKLPKKDREKLSRKDREKEEGKNTEAVPGANSETPPQWFIGDYELTSKRTAALMTNNRGNQVTGEYTEPWSAVLTPKGHVAVTLRRHKCIAVWSGNGDTMAEFGHEHLRCPTGLAVEKDGRFIVTDEQANKVYIFSPSRVLQCVLGEEAGITFNQPRHVCLSTTGRIIVSDSGHHCVKIFNKDGIYVNKIGEFGSGDGQFKFPYGVCVDQEGHIIVSDHYNNRVSMFHADGTFMQHLVTAKNGVKRPRGVAVRCAHNRKLFVTHGGLRATEVLVFRMTLNVSELLINVKCFV